jgi:hypothetical protein
MTDLVTLVEATSASHQQDCSSDAAAENDRSRTVTWLRWATICFLAPVMACTSSDQYAAFQSQKYSGSPAFSMRDEWGAPVSRARLISGARYYSFRKPGTDCRAGVWADSLDVVVRVTVGGPSTCADGF